MVSNLNSQFMSYVMNRIAGHTACTLFMVGMEQTSSWETSKETGKKPGVTVQLNVNPNKQAQKLQAGTPARRIKKIHFI